MSKVFVNYGHGGNDSGATGNGLLEKDLNKKIGSKIVSGLKKKYDVTVKSFQQSQSGNGLRTITNEANKWKPDLFVSIHINAGGGTGFESFIFNGKVSNKTKNNQNVIHDEIIKKISKYSVVDRGKKSANFHVLRETVAPALLTENMFIDNKKDSELLKNDEFINDVAEGHILGIAKVLNLKPKKTEETKTNKKTFYRVVTGSFSDKENADKRVKELKKKGFDSFITTYKKGE